MSLRTRLLLALVGIAALAVGSFAVPLAFSESSRIRNAADIELRRDANRVSLLVPDDFADNGGAVPLPVEDDDLSGAVYDRSGKRLAGDGPDRADAIVTSALAGSVGCGTVGDERVCAQPIIEEAKAVGAIRAAEPFDVAQSRIRKRLIGFASGATAVLVVAALAALAAARRLTKPVLDIHDAAVKLGAGEFAIEVPRSGIREMDETGDALASAASRIGSVLERERAFSADASHQLRTPITSLRATLETEQLAPRADPSIVLHEALHDVERLESTVAELLALARNAPTDRAILSIPDVVERIGRSWRKRTDRVGRAIVVEVDPLVSTIPVRASRVAIEQILDVLLVNAERHGRGTITLRALVVGGSGVRIRISDEGPGISGDPSKIFDRGTSGGDGHGIGLALARSLAEGEGGALTLENPGPEPVFQLTLPAADAAEGAPMRADRRGNAASRARGPR